jgi:phosphatidylserine decarboxylase
LSSRAAQPAAGWLDRLKYGLFCLLPQHAISRLVFSLTRIETPWFKNAFIRWFADTYRIDWEEAEYRRPEDYPSFNAFFTRALRPGARPLAGSEDTVVSPADGYISQIGAIDRDTVFQAKGHSFTVTELLGGDSARAADFQDGSFATVYLSPSDYHRVHMPVGGTLRETVYVPGRLFSVAPWTVRTIPRLFARNERLAAIFDTGAGPMAMVLVGAINVAAIETVWSGLVTPPPRPGIEVNDKRGERIALARGAEMGRFNMGSTVILLFGRRRVDWLDGLQTQQRLRMGQAIGQLQGR